MGQIRRGKKAGEVEPVMAHLVESGQIGLKELRELEALLQKPKDPRNQ